jgi:hypothetical protein
MANSTERFEWLTHQLGVLVESLRVTHGVEERKLLLRRMRVLIVEIDMLIASNLKRDSEDAPSTPPLGQSTVDA